MREDIQVLDHVEPPNDVRVLVALVFFILNAVVLTVLQTLGVGTNDLATIAYIVDAIAIHHGSGTNALVGPVVDETCRQLVMNRLPEETSVGFAVAAEDPLVSRHRRLVRGGPVPAHINLSIDADWS